MHIFQNSQIIVMIGGVGAGNGCPGEPGPMGGEATAICLGASVETSLCRSGDLTVTVPSSLATRSVIPNVCVIFSFILTLASLSCRAMVAAR